MKGMNKDSSKEETKHNRRKREKIPNKGGMRRGKRKDCPS